MMHQGLLDEVKALHPYQHLPALQTVGYSELWSHLHGQTTLEEAVALIKRNTRRYAKRQLTWFRHQLPQTHWLPHDNTASFIDLIKRTWLF
jgi:tRNA dimethylallyltransferase